MAEELNEDKPKSNNQLPRVATDCKVCVFHNIKGKKCYLGKLDKYIEDGAMIEERDGQYLVDRICLFRRDGAWRSENRVRKNIDRARDEALGLVKISGTVIIYADKLDSLKKCIESLSHSEYVKNFKVIVAHFDELKIKEVYDYINEQDVLEEVFAIQIKDRDETNFLDEAIRQSKNGLIITLDSDKDVDLSIFDKLQKYMYSDMKRLLYVQPSDGIHECVVQGVLYKFLKGNKFWTFDEKIKQLAEEQDIENQILKWSDINESVG